MKKRLHLTLKTLLRLLCLIASGCIILLASTCGSNTGSKRDWINENAVSLSTVDPLDSTTGDLKCLKHAIGNSRVVLLGEAEHGDGSTFLLKSRIVKYLHHELGFKVIAFEGTFYGLNKSWEEYLEQRKTFGQVKDHLYVMWKESKQCEDLFKYIERESKGKNQLALSGIDSRQVGELGIADALDSILAASNVDLSKTEHTFFRKVLTDVLRLEYRHKIPTNEQNRFLKILNEYEQHLSKSNINRFWVQELRNTRGYVLHSWRSTIDESKHLYNGSFRDSQMADNLMWLLNEKYKGEKIIVWAANAHVVKNFSEIDSIFYGQEIPVRGAEHCLGEYLYHRDVDMYSLITISYSGKGADFEFKEFPYENAKDGSLEKMFHDGGFTLGFLNVKNKFGNQVIRSGLPGYVNVNLKSTCDGILFIDEMQPITRIEISETSK